jgi:uncharacterized membrane protein
MASVSHEAERETRPEGTSQTHRTQWGTTTASVDRAGPRGALRLARGLGWFSIGLGLVELAAPRRFARAIGAPPRTGLVRACGAREVLAGIGILGSARPAGWVWSRVVGDLIDLALLGAARGSWRARPDRLRLAAGGVAGATALDLYDAARLSQRAAPEGPVRIAQGITVNRPREQVYRFWRDVQNLPSVLSHLESVRSTGDRAFHCTARANGGSPLEWDAEIAEDQPNERIEWRSLPSSRMRSEGRVHFQAAPGDRGTEVHVELEYEAPGGAMGRELAQLLGRIPAHQIREDLRRFKQVIETGETIRSDATLDGRELRQRPAQPPEQAPELPARAQGER